MKNKKLIIVLLLVLFIPAVSIFAGYLVSQYIIKPYIAKQNVHTKYSDKEVIEVHGIDLYSIIIGEYSNFDDAKYNYDILKMKNIYSRIYENSGKYFLVGGACLSKDDADTISKFLKSYQINNSIYFYKGSIIRLEYDKKETNNVLLLRESLNKFENLLELMSKLSDKALSNAVEESDITSLENEVNKIKNLNVNADYDKNITKIKSELYNMNDVLMDYIKKLKISVALQDGNSYELLQSALWESSNRFNDLLNSLIKKN